MVYGVLRTASLVTWLIIGNAFEEAAVCPPPSWAAQTAARPMGARGTPLLSAFMCEGKWLS